jgi:hypothetical protein
MSISEDAAYWSAGIVFAGIVLATTIVWIRNWRWVRAKFARTCVKLDASPRE